MEELTVLFFPSWSKIQSSKVKNVSRKLNILDKNLARKAQNWLKFQIYKDCIFDVI